MKWVILFFVICILLRIFEAKIKGRIGEHFAASELAKLPHNHYKLLNDIMLNTNYGTTQIDHIVVSIYGIFVIETKNYQGWITGGEHSEQWVKNMYGKKYYFRNPIKQNYAHVKALENDLGLTTDKFIPIVAFSGRSELKVKTSKPVLYIKQLRNKIQEYCEIKFDESDLDLISKRILDSNVNLNSARNAHVKQIRSKMKTDKLKKNSGICPRCGGELVRRKGKYGIFIGCKNFPKCRYTVK